MLKQCKGENNSDVFVSEEEHRGPLHCSKDQDRCSFLGNTPDAFLNEEMELDYLASLVVEVFLTIENE